MENKRKIIMYLGLFILLVNFLCSYSQIFSYGGNINTILSTFGMLLLLISSYLKRTENVIIKTTLLLLAFISYYISKQSGFFQLMVILVSLKNENINQIIKFIFKITSIFLLIHIFIYILLYLYDKSKLIFNIRSNEQIVRHMFLFSHANFLGALCSWNCLAYLYLNRNCLKSKHLFFAFLYVLFIFAFPNSRTAGTILLITILVLTIRNNIPKMLKIIIKYSILIFALLSIFCIYLYPSLSIVQELDESLNARIKLGYVAYEVYGIKPFGQDISFGSINDTYKEEGISSVVIDSSYYKILISYGFVSFILALFLYAKEVRKIPLSSNKIFFFLPYALFACMETTGIFPLLAFSLLILDDKEYQNER